MMANVTELNATNLSSWVLLICKGLESYDIDPQPILQELNIESTNQLQQGGRLCRKQVVTLWTKALEATGDPYLALKVKKHFEPIYFSALGMAISASRNGHDALQRMVRYSHMISNGSDVKLVYNNDRITVIHEHIVDVSNQPHMLDLECVFAIAIDSLRTICNEHLKPIKVEFKHRFPFDQTPFQEAFGCPVEFNASRNSVTFRYEDLVHPSLFANTQLTAHLDQWIEEQLMQFSQKSLSSQVKQFLIERIPHGEVDQAKVADAFSMSPRYLQKCLQAEGQTYKRLVDESKKKLAKVMLKQHHSTLTDISFCLGFSDQSNFCRAFKRWTGISPKQFRRQTAS